MSDISDSLIWKFQANGHRKMKSATQLWWKLQIKIFPSEMSNIFSSVLLKSHSIIETMITE